MGYLDFTIRLNSMDLMCVNQVIHENCYGLPDQFAGSDVIIDIGANIGTFAMACYARGARAIYCYEPHPSNFRLLSFNMHGSKAKVHELALWKKSDKVGLMDNAPRATAMWRLTGDGDVTVNCVSLDQILRPHTSVRLLKLDCEGGEWPGLYECTRLKSCQEIIVELHPSLPCEGYDCSPDAMKKYLTSLGFCVSTWGEAPGDNVYMRAINGDMVV